MIFFLKANSGIGWPRDLFLLIPNFHSLVHPCDEANNGGCSQICNKLKEKHECSCEPAFVLGEDKATCQKG